MSAFSNPPPNDPGLPLNLPNSVALVDSVPYVVYVNRGAANASDVNNSGLSPGNAFLTINKAISVLNQQHGGIIYLWGQGVGPYSATAQLHAVTPITIVGTPTHGVEIDRTFTTPNGRSVWDAVTTVNGTTIASVTAAFVAGDVNKIVSVYGAGLGGGTYYDFVSSITDGTHIVIANSSGTPIARNSTTDPKGVKMSLVGDWNRVVIDVGITSGQSAVTSNTAAWTSADIGTEIVIAGAGPSGQALRAAILSVQSATQAIIVGKASTTVAGARCAIGVIFGDLFTAHVSGCGLKNVVLADRTIGNNTIGAPVKGLVDMGIGIGTGAVAITDVEIDSNDATGAWEHIFEIDGSWNQNVSGPGFRQVSCRNFKAFGARKVLEAIRISNGLHVSFTGGFLVASPVAASQGITVLDPQRSAGGGYATADVHFDGFEHIGTYFYCEGQPGTNGFLGARIGSAIGDPSARIMALRFGTDVVVRESWERQYGQAGVAITSGTLWAATVPVLAGDPPFGHVAFDVTSAATLGTNNDSHWYIAIYDGNNALIVQTADQLTGALGQGIHNIALSSNLLVSQDTLLTVALMVYVGTGGAPVAPSIAHSPGADMGQLLAQWGRSGVLGQVTQTTGVAPSPFTVSGTPSKMPWFALHA